ncbi:hypothetical protein CCACVL1_06281 [Corchorus capsularis]|uniref:Hydroxyproline-rich glycoprotein family protein n=1 Tax=Corchorus capsularis TaxID=210143 RepID=A0A1R3JGG3_COCAP|nr:hypothetical protein CCACVL1_06281 [Corchorus capsularis]
MKGPKKDISSSPVNLILMMELRKKLLTFRDIIDLPPCQTIVSMDVLLQRTIKDLHSFYPGSIPQYHSAELKGLPLDKVLIYFCKALQELGDTSKMNDEWIDKYRYNIFENDKCKNVERLVEIAVATLHGLIKIAKEKFDMMDEYEEKKDYSPKENTFGKALKDSYNSDNVSGSSSPVTPTSVLPDELINGSPKSPSSSSLLLSLRVQAVGKLNPIDVKRLTLRMLPDASGSKNSSRAEDSTSVKDDSVSNSGNASDGSSKDGKITTTSPPKSPNVAAPPSSPPPPPSSPQPPELWRDIEVAEEKLSSSSPEAVTPPQPLESPKFSTDTEMYKGELLSEPLEPEEKVLLSSPPLKPAVLEIDIKSLPPPPPPPPPPPRGRKPLPPTPTTPPSSPTNKAEESKEVAETGGAAVTPPPPPPPPSRQTGSRRTASVVPPPPPPMLIASKGSVSFPPTPRLISSNGGAAPPPPPPIAAKSLRPKRSTTKLKRSSHMGNLYRILKVKLEGSNTPGKSPSGRRSGVGSGGNGKQGMADALAEMTRRSAYFQQIEQDVQKYAKAITEIKTSISTFKTTDMTELLKFHKNVESVLEKLTDETQVLARFEGFPIKKLETIRAAAALHLKFESIINELQKWKVEPPVSRLLDNAERYFNKIKGEVDAMERTKDEESKKFKSHNIEFDFLIIVRIKEAMVDLSSNCMEIALKERREAKLADNKTQNKSNTKLLWKAFQFAFRVYTFAGGHDERADRLTRELAKEIETDPEYKQSK